MTDSTSNLGCAQSAISRADRERLLGQSGLVVWFTGLSGSGKSSLAIKTEAELSARGRLCYRLDGDVLRAGLCSDLSFSDKDRRENIRRAGEAAALLADAGLIVLCSFISPFAADRSRVRELVGLKRFYEVFVDAPLAVCETRDPKGLYRLARRGEITSFTGIDSAYEQPVNPELHLKTDELGIDQCTAQILKMLNYSG